MVCVATCNDPHPHITHPIVISIEIISGRE